MRLSPAVSPDVKRWREFGKTAAVTFPVNPMWLSSPRFGASIPVGWRSKIIRSVWGWRPACRTICRSDARPAILPPVFVLQNLTIYFMLESALSFFWKLPNFEPTDGEHIIVVIKLLQDPTHPRV